MQGAGVVQGLQGIAKTRYHGFAGKKTNKRLSHKHIRRFLKAEAQVSRSAKDDIRGS